MSLPLLSAMLGDRAAAQAALGARRLIWMYQPSGSLLEHWPDPGPLSTLHDMFTPLLPFRSQMLAIRNVNNLVRQLLEVRGLGPHDCQAPHLLTGAPVWTSALRPAEARDLVGDILPNGTASRATLDHVLASQAPYRDLAIPCLQVGHSVSFSIPDRPLIRHISYRGPNQPALAENSTRAIYNRLVGLARPPAPGPAVDPRPKAISDAVLAEYRAMRGKLSGPDRARMELHLSDLETLATETAAPPPPAASCGPHPFDAAGDPTTIFSSTRAGWEAKTKAQVDNMVMALKCDLTRIITFQWGQSMGSFALPWLSPDLPSVVTNTSLHDLGHQLGALPGETGNCGGTPCQQGAPNSLEHMRRVQKLFWVGTAYLLDQLKRASLPDGSNLLDNTLVIYSTELARGATHEVSRMGHLLFGNLGGFFKGGECIDARGASHTQLVTSVAQAMGLKDALGQPISHFGSADLPSAQRRALTEIHR
ncbi:MAG: DUF1552 domain-containing protein [Myxococcaceae bacterium]|nr:DUF1552 domain-containing protein [Myxococcaceae bacterium]